MSAKPSRGYMFMSRFSCCARVRKTRRSMLIGAISMAMGGAAILSTPTWAAEWPSKPIKVVVPYTPGGSTDTVTRIVMEKLSLRLKQSIIIENRPGANSSVGTAIAAKSSPDGYTFLSVLPAYAINPHLHDLPYTPSQLEPVVHMVDMPLFLFVAKDLPVNSVAELVDYGRKNPDKLTYASSGIGAAAHLFGADFALKAKFEMTHVPYKGSAPILADLLGGRVSMVADPMLVPMQHVKQGRLKVLAVTGKQRWANEPHIPTMIESGYPDFATGGWAGLLAPAGTPKPIIDRMAKEISDIVREPEVAQKFLEVGYLPTGYGPAEFAQLIRAESDRYAKLIKQANITVN